VAGFRIGRGRPAQQRQQRPQQQPAQWPAAPGSAPHHDDAPGHTRAFTVPDSASAYPYQGQPYQGGHQGQSYPGGHQAQSYEGQSYEGQSRQGQSHQGQDQGRYDDRYDDYPYEGDEDHVATYRAGNASGPPAGPRLRWQELLSGVILRPSRTFWQMRDYQVWGPALLVTFVYGLLAVFGFDSARQDVLSSSTADSVPWVIVTAIAVVFSGLIMGAVTHTLARQFGGDGNWAPTIGLAMLITSLTDAPRLLFAIFLGGANEFVQIVGWLTWLACAALLTSMVGKSHDLPWQKALGAASIQLIALLVLFKLPTL
jgi:Yip1 domain